MMRLIILLTLGYVLVGTIASSSLLDRAEAELEKDLFRRTLNGATSPRLNRKKVTLMSRAISRRNAIFAKSMSLLMSDGVEKDQARQIVRAALKERKSKRKKGAGGQSGQTDEVTLADDMCEDFEITCS